MILENKCVYPRDVRGLTAGRTRTQLNAEVLTLTGGHRASTHDARRPAHRTARRRESGEVVCEARDAALHAGTSDIATVIGVVS